MNTTEKSFEYASKTSKLLITLSTGIIAFTIAFFDKDAVMKPSNNFERVILLTSWIIFLASAIVGVWTQLALTDVLEPQIKPTPFTPTIRNEKIKFPFRIQSVTFILGNVMTVLYGCVKIF